MIKTWFFKTAHNLGMQGSAMAIAAVIWWTQIPIIITGHEGPVDAPQKMLHGSIRAFLWFFTGAICLYASKYRDKRIRYYGVAALFVMPTFRLFGYAWSWVMTWPPVDYLIDGPSSDLAGDGGAWSPMLGQSLPYEVLALFVFFAPYAWPIYDRHDRNKNVGKCEVR